MEISYAIFFHEIVIKEDLPQLDSVWKENIRKAIHLKLKTSPELYGAPLRQTLKGLRKLRVGDYRIIYKIEGKVVKIIIIDHRRVVYRKILKRI